MHILVVGLNHKTTPVEIREKFQFQSDLDQALTALRQSKSILESVIISTCNRTELYVVADQLHTGRYYSKMFLSEWFDVPKEEFSHHLVIREDEHAIEHLLRLSCGLDSMILGETQILGQVRDAFLKAQELDTVGTIFNYSFRQAIALAKRVQAETGINDNPVSVSYAAVELGKQIFGDFNGKEVLVMGAGKMSELTAKHLTSSGVSQITVMNRTMEKAIALADRFDGRARTFTELSDTLLETDVLISSTGSDQYVLKEEDVRQIMKKRKGRPLFLVDIAVPRDLDPELNELDNVYLYDIDDLQGIVEANLEDRKEAAEQIELMIEEELVVFGDWLDTLGVVPVISALRSKASSIQEGTMESLERKLSHMTDREKKVIRKHMKSIINQMLRDPITALKEVPNEESPDELLDYFTRVFNLDDHLDGKEPRITTNIKINRKEREFNIARRKALIGNRKKVAVRSF
ncbi:glutamyl-tRNA reductase [Salisediminibacterium selenitireducens]|uniref:Glutamyl-tRNA reductase n=1 Tax=Bacillus selenitireducens (strain ATCC 700615 / DSM 15326 / MLS10) TaxID=439292 RepID=D6XSZ5_BACIE|nr:glutamyl-tRNA reductase [Salisediminibacterium selenitireducens]ADH98931.1 glutamyl-tRNA reductase [[Bacillus] selenitireducens MLS10]